MKKFFSKLFSKKSDNFQNIISFDILDQIFNYLYDRTDGVSFEMKNFPDQVFFNQYNFPHSFDHDEAKREFKKLKLKDSFALANLVHEKCDIGPITQDMIDDAYELNFLHIQFFLDHNPAVKSGFKHDLHNFLVFFCCKEGSDQTSDFRILYAAKDDFDNYATDLLKVTNIETDKLENQLGSDIYTKFQLVLMGFFEFTKTMYPPNINFKIVENLLAEKATLSHFEELLELVNRGAIDDKTVKKVAKKMFGKFVKNLDFYDYFEAALEYLESVNCWNSDWKFDTEDAEYFISEMIGQELNFEFPPDTYSHDLFPYIQNKLATLDLELLSFETHGDNYLFFLANKNDSARIFELAQITKIDIDKL